MEETGAPAVKFEVETVENTPPAKRPSGEIGMDREVNVSGDDVKLEVENSSEEAEEGGSQRKTLTKSVTLRDLYCTLQRTHSSALPEDVEKADDLSRSSAEDGMDILKPIAVSDDEYQGRSILQYVETLHTLPEEQPVNSTLDGSGDLLPASNFASRRGKRRESVSAENSPRKIFGALTKRRRSRTGSKKGRSGIGSGGSSESSGTPSPILSPDTMSPRAAEEGAVPTKKGSFRKFVKKDKAEKALDKIRREGQREEKKFLKVEKRKERLRRKEISEFISLIIVSAMHFPREDLFKDLPVLKLCPPKKRSAELQLVCSGPSVADETVVRSINSRIAARSISTYPHLKGKPQREGSPICDSYLTELYQDGTAVFAVADGCGWGTRPREAAIKAKVAMVQYISAHRSKIKDSETAANVLLRGLSLAHYKIIEGKNDIFTAGTTTLLGGFLAPLPDGLFCFFFISVGDCKAYCRKKGSGRIIDLTAGFRNNVSDAKDPGGRIGPYVKNGLPDFRNLRTSYCICEEGDILFMTSDGVSDNFDPEHHGILPNDLGEESASSWEDLELEVGLKLKSEWGCVEMGKVLDAAIAEDETGGLAPIIVDSLVGYCEKLTESSRDWMQSESKGQLPKDYSLYPGKMDHTTVLAIEVTSSSENSSNTSGKSSPTKNINKKTALDGEKISPHEDDKDSSG